MAPAESSEDDDDVSTSAQAWLDPVELPNEQQLLNVSTQEPLDFLLQVYCPVDDNEMAFHRTIFLFAPREGKNIKKPGSIRAFRCQLPRQNRFYAYSPSKDRYPQKVPETTHDPWAVVDSEACMARGEPLPRPQGRTLFPEFQLVTESEQPPSQPTSPQTRSPGVESEGEEAMQASDVTSDVEEAIASNTTPEQKHFAEFAARVSWNPEQVLRYNFQEGAEPLWPSPSPVPLETDLPSCPNCSARRRFEFQVMPQLLSSLEIDDEQDSALDWGTVAVYSCSASCQGPVAYQEEFVYVQA